ncbi:GNAT family N-acetyltransferase [Methylocapsa sp. S129]|uniref:GNAT family N-acetyltransferase n=1 Tax=Methylocapsa sp. S129 TaxID=1641869 RepID=UPI001FEF7668|nr:GNAT family N-acetyltransferase [Methylocapsa sp. S129]
MREWQHATMEIRNATDDDAAAACVVMRRSIAELCVADHQNDAAMLARWLGNKTPENFLAWIARPSNCVLVAVEGDVILAVGCVTDTGEINLNYVSPDARFRGISRAMLKALEERARERGNARCRLTSTGTARRFYRAAGYIEDAPAPFKFGIPDYPMSRILDVDRS